MPVYPNRILDNPLSSIQDFLRSSLDDQYYRGYNFIGKWEMFKLASSDKERKLAAHNRLWERAYQKSTWTHITEDNWFRFSFLAVLDRLWVVRQASMFTSNLAFTSKNNMSAALNAIRNQGLFFGAMRGNFLNILHFYAVQAQAYIYSEGQITKYLTNVLFLETLFYPLDCLTVRWQADVSGRYKNLLDCFNKTKPAELYSGLPSKLIFSTIYGIYLSQAGSSTLLDNWVNLPLLALAYPFLTLRTIGEVTLTSGSFARNFFKSLSIAEKLIKTGGVTALYRGFTPFAAMAFFAPHWIPRVWTKEQKDTALEALNPHLFEKKSEFVRNG